MGTSATSGNCVKYSATASSNTLNNGVPSHSSFKYRANSVVTDLDLGINVSEGEDATISMRLFGYGGENNANGLGPRVHYDPKELGQFLGLTPDARLNHGKHRRQITI